MVRIKTQDSRRKRLLEANFPRMTDLPRSYFASDAPRRFLANISVSTSLETFKRVVLGANSSPTATACFYSKSKYVVRREY